MQSNSVADLGFPRRRGNGCQLLDMGQKPIIWQDFSRKLQEMKDIGLIGGGGVGAHVPSRPPQTCQHNCRSANFLVLVEPWSMVNCYVTLIITIYKQSLGQGAR